MIVPSEPGLAAGHVSPDHGRRGGALSTQNLDGAARHAGISAACCHRLKAFLFESRSPNELPSRSGGKVNLESCFRPTIAPRGNGTILVLSAGSRGRIPAGDAADRFDFALNLLARYREEETLAAPRLPPLSAQAAQSVGLQETAALKWTPFLGPLAKVCSVVLYRNGWSERHDEVTQEV